MNKIKRIVRHPLFVLVIASLIVVIGFFAENLWFRYRGKRLYEYYFSMIDDKYLHVSVRYTVKEGMYTKDLSEVVLPHNFNISEVNIIRGNITHWALVPYNYFYDVYKFEYVTDGKGLFIVEFNYTLKYGVLIVEPYAMFLSPMIYHDKRAIGVAYINLRLPRARVLQINPYPSKVFEGKEELIVKYRWTESPGRIWMILRISETSTIVNITSPPFTFVTPNRYAEEAKMILDVYSKAYPILANIIGVNLQNVIVRFFVPKIYSEIYIIGFVPYSPPPRPNEIYLNVIYLRSYRGMLEYGAVHELVHHFLLKVGISPYGLLWVHEGLAEYLGITVTAIIDKEGKFTAGIEKRKELLNTLASLLNNKYGFVQRWMSSAVSGNVMYCYAASYTIFKKLVDEYGGLNFLYRVFDEMRKYGEVTSTSMFIEILSNVAGQKVYSVFKEWGFIIVRKEEVVKALNVCENLMNQRNILSYFIKNNMDKARFYINKGFYATALSLLHKAFILTLLGIIIEYLGIMSLSGMIIFLIIIAIELKLWRKGEVLGS